MIRNVSVNDIRPAPYNPRRIDSEDFGKLCASVERLGIIVPVIVNRKNNVIVAGHQRTKAAKAIGIETVPALYAENISLEDEVTFNQIHNGTDYDQGETAAIDPQESTGFIDVPPSQNHAVCAKKAVVSAVCKLIERYGNVLSCVATMDGEVFKAPAYAEACRVLNIPAHVYVVPRDHEGYAKAAFSRSYGVFSYDHLQKNTWVQGLAQRSRRPTKTMKDGTAASKTYRSRLYEELVIPSISKTDRVLDFGAGKGQYAAMLNGMGYSIRTMEFYHNNGKGINVARGKLDISRLADDVRRNGKFDAVVLDSVLNSVDSRQAERAVMGACCAFLKDGGTLYFSGRRKKSVDSKINMRKQAYIKNDLYFLDADGLSASFRRGNFFYQMFHTDDQIRDLAASNNLAIEDFKADGNSWRCRAVKDGPSPNERSGIEFEFTLPYPGGRYDADSEMLDALGMM